MENSKKYLLFAAMLLMVPVSSFTQNPARAVAHRPTQNEQLDEFFPRIIREVETDSAKFTQNSFKANKIIAELDENDLCWIYPSLDIQRIQFVTNKQKKLIVELELATMLRMRELVLEAKKSEKNVLVEHFKKATNNKFHV